MTSWTKLERESHCAQRAAHEPHGWVQEVGDSTLWHCSGREVPGDFTAAGMQSTTQPETQVHDEVNHPSHYTSHPSGIECITITRHLNFNVGNAIKYLWRAGLKDQTTSTTDLEKAIWYLQDEVRRLRGEL